MSVHFFKKTFHSIFLLMLLSIGNITLMITGADSFMSIAHAQSDDAKTEQKPKYKTKRTPALREPTYKKLSKAQELAEQEKYQAALNVLNTLRAEQNLNSYEKAMAWNFTAFTYSAQEKYAQAIKAYQQVLAQDALPEALELNSLYSMGQLYLATEKYTQAVSTLQKWFKVAASPNPSAYVLLGQAYYQLSNFKAAASSIEKALALQVKQGAQPNEQSLLILRASYYELEDTKKVVGVLEQLTNLYPKGEYFYQLAGQYVEQNKEKKALLTIEAAYDGGYLDKEGQYVLLASLLLSNDVPYKAAKVLVDGTKKKIIKETVSNLRMQAQAWYLAQEPQKSITVLKKAAKKSDDGELYVRLGSAHADLDEWENCASSIRSGLKKGKVKRVDSANITLGVCLYNQDKLDSAIAAFDRALKDKRSEKVAVQWLNFLRGEKDRRNRIANSLL